MRRVFALWASTALLLALGCGGRSYEVRLEKTLEDLKYRKKLDDNLIPAPEEGKFKELMIFVRPPKSLAGPTKEFLLTVVEPGKFDIAESFTEKDVQNMYVLGRVKRPKAPTKKGAAPAPAVARGDFTADVLSVLAGVYNVELDAPKIKEEKRKNNAFRYLTLEANGKTIPVYFYGGKGNPYEVALIFEYPKTENLAEKIRLCLESFATGEKARRSFSGSVTEDESTESAGSPAVF